MEKSGKQSTQTPKVSVLCIAFNQEKYIAQTLDGFVMQKTDFPFEIVIHDDASTDKTADIIRAYAKKYPHLFRPILEKVNQYTTTGDQFVVDMFRQARGQYIAVCEGDDYWTDPEKLQRQVDFLDRHPDYTVCFHPVTVTYENGERPDAVFPESYEKIPLTTERLLHSNFIQTNSVLYRRQNYDQMRAHVVPQDWYLHLYHAQFGKIGRVNRIMGVYRRHAGSAWWDTDKHMDEIWRRHGLGHLELYAELQRLFGDNSNYKKIIDEHSSQVLRALLRVDRLHKENNLEKAIRQFPIAVETFIVQETKLQQEALKKLKQHADEQAKIIASYVEKTQHLEAENLELQKHLARKLNESLVRTVARKIKHRPKA